MFRNLVIAIHVIWIVVFTFIIIDELFSRPLSQVDSFFLLLVSCIYIPPIVTLWYLLGSPSKSNGKSNEEGLLSLWLKVRRKKLKDELKK